MIRKIYYAILFPFYKAYWFIFRPSTFGVKCVVECNGRILMIRNSYGRKRWTFPGGKIEKGESAGDAVKREVVEEVGIKLKSISYIGQFISTVEKKKDTIICFKAVVDSDNFKVDPKEIMVAEWFLPDNFPDPLSPIAKRIVELWENNKK